MGTYNILCKTLSPFHRQTDLPFRVHDIDICNSCKTMICRCFQVGFRIGTPAGISCITFNDSSVYFPHQIADKCRLQEIMPAGFSRTQFHGNFT